MNAIVSLGAPGSGKTTVGKGVAAELGLSYIGSGDIARNMARIDDDAAESLEKGEMAPELAMRAEILARIEGATIQTGDFVIEGFPRTIEQVFILESLDDIKPIYILIDLDELECMRRIIARRRDQEYAEVVATRFRTWWENMGELTIILGEQMFDVDGLVHPSEVQDQVLDIYRRVGK